MLENVPKYLFPKENTPPPQPTVYGAEYYTDRLTLIQTVQKLALIIQQCIDSINRVDPDRIVEFINLAENLSDEVTTLSAEVLEETKKVSELSTKVTDFENRISQFATDVEAAVNDAAAAKTMAESAETKASTAITTANDADAAAKNAVTLANTAVGTANAASARADEAKTDATNAITTANNAEDAALAATTTANNAANAAATATTNADNAVTTANNASATASTAKTTADTAATDAADAMMDAADAVQKANTATTIANTASETAATANTKADAAVTTANDAKTTASGIDAKATKAQTDATEALTKATAAETYAKTAVKTVNNIAPDENGNVNVAGGSGDVRTVNGVAPDSAGNVQLVYDANLNTTSNNAVQNKTVNAAITNINNAMVKTVNNKLPVDGNVTIEIPPAITIDSQFDLTSTNPVQNKVVSEGINNLNDLKADKTVVNELDKNAVKTVNGLPPIDGNVNTVTDLTLSTTSNNPIANSIVTKALDAKGNVSVDLNTSTETGIPPLSVLEMLMPIGYIFECDPSGLSGAPALDTPEKVHDYFGFGTWESYGAGRFTIAASDNYAIGNEYGSSETALTSNNLPAKFKTNFTTKPYGSGSTVNFTSSAISANSEISGNIEVDINPNGGQAFSVLNPAKAVYRYRRIS